MESTTPTQEQNMDWWKRQYREGFEQGAVGADISLRAFSRPWYRAGWLAGAEHYREEQS